MKRLIALTAALSIVLVQTANAKLDLPYSDVSDNYSKYNVLEFMFNRGIMTGYPDGTFQPDRILNRAELLKIIVASTYDEAEYSAFAGDSCFLDVPAGEWFTEYVCFGKDRGIIEGYSDGTFKPAQYVNMVEALKIMLVGMNVNVPESGGEWYQKYLDAADANYLLPESLKNSPPDNDISRIQAGEVIKNIVSLKADIVQPPVYTSEGGYEPGSVYLGYLQHADVLDVYVVADSNIEEAVLPQGLSFSVANNTVLDTSQSDKGVILTVNDQNFNFEVSGPVYTNQTVHIATLYLETDTKAAVTNSM
jgi:hypothetical protein